MRFHIFLTTLCKILLFTLIFVFLLYRIVVYSQVRPFHEDETTSMDRAQLFDVYTSGKFSDPVWLTESSYDQPMLVYLLYGMLLHVRFGKPVHTILLSYHFLDNQQKSTEDWRLKYSRNFCCSIKNLPLQIQEKITPILIVRTVPVFFAICSLMLVFLIGLHIKNYLYALLTLVIIGINPLFLSSMVTAMGDSPLICFSLLFLYISIVRVKDIQLKTAKGVFSILLLGIIGGLAIATKLNGGINLVYFTCILCLFLLKNRLSLLAFFAYLFILFVSAFDVFLILNPFIWKNPLHNMLYMLIYRVEVFHSQQTNNVFSQVSLTNPLERVHAFYTSLVMPGAPLGNFLFISPLVPIDALLLLLGCFLLCKSFIHVFRKYDFIKQTWTNGTIIGQILLLFWSLTWLILTIVCIPLNWERYWLLSSISICFLQCFGLEFLIQQIKALLFLRSKQ